MKWVNLLLHCTNYVVAVIFEVIQLLNLIDLILNEISKMIPIYSSAILESPYQCLLESARIVLLILVLLLELALLRLNLSEGRLQDLVVLEHFLIARAVSLIFLLVVLEGLFLPLIYFQQVLMLTHQLTVLRIILWIVDSRFLGNGSGLSYRLFLPTQSDVTHTEAAGSLFEWFYILI
jgi:hypothetical protein